MYLLPVDLVSLVYRVVLMKLPNVVLVILVLPPLGIHNVVLVDLVVLKSLVIPVDLVWDLVILVVPLVRSF